MHMKVLPRIKENCIIKNELQCLLTNKILIPIIYHSVSL